MPKKKIVLSSTLALITAFLGITGSLGWCCTIAGAAIFSFLGLASLSTFLVYNNEWLILTSFIFTCLAIFYYIKYKRNKECSINKN